MLKIVSLEQESNQCLVGYIYRPPASHDTPRAYICYVHPECSTIYRKTYRTHKINCGRWWTGSSRVSFGTTITCQENYTFHLIQTTFRSPFPPPRLSLDKNTEWPVYEGIWLVEFHRTALSSRMYFTIIGLGVALELYNTSRTVQYHTYPGSPGKRNTAIPIVGMLVLRGFIQMVRRHGSGLIQVVRLQCRKMCA